MESSKQMKSYMYKIVILGEGAVGKTSLRNRYMGRGFNKDYIMTIGADFSEKKINTVRNIHGKEEEVEIVLQIWDLAGQENFKNIRKRFLMSSSGLILVIDLTRYETLTAITSWIREIWHVLKDEAKCLLLIGNKVDLDTQRKIEKIDISKFLQQIRQQSPKKSPINLFFRNLKFFKYIETSALSGENVDNAFKMLVEGIISFQPGNASR